MKKNFFVATVLLISLSASAQDTTNLMNEVVVTANKFPNKTSLTGKVVSVITREQLEKSGGKDLSQILTEQTGVFINGANSNPGKDKSVYLRGAKVDHTLICVDGVPLYDPSGIGSNFDIRLLSVDNIERIEILKGSQSSLYGSDAMAGVINIITRKIRSGSTLQGLMSAGSYGTYKTNINLSGGMPKTEYTVNFSHFSSKGINEIEDTSAAAVKERDSYQQTNLYESFTWKPNQHVKLKTYLRYAKFKQDYDQGAFTDELDLTSKNDNIQVGFINEYKFNKLQFNLLFNYNDNKRTYIDDSTLSQNGFSKYSRGIYNGQEYFADAYGSYSLNEKIKITAGIDYRKSNSEQQFLSISEFFGPYSSNLSKDILQQRQLGIYSSLNTNLFSKLNIEVGGRWNQHSEYGNNMVYNFNPSYLINQQWKMYVNVSSAYKTPTLYQLYSEFGNKSLKPEVAQTMEIGTQWLAKDNKENVRLTVFSRSVNDVINFYTDMQTYASYYINQDKQKDYGLEMEGAVKLKSNTNIRFVYSYVNGNITTKNGENDTSYFNLIRRPKHNLNVFAEHQINKKIYVSGTVNYVGKRTDITYNSSFEQVELVLKSYMLVNAYAEYALGKNKIKLFFDVRNLLNTKYTEVYGFNTMGTNVTGGIRFSY
jgi:vitamin B12 transporter